MTAAVYKTPNPVGVNQMMLIEGMVYPPPGNSIDLTFSITKPDKTVETIVKASDLEAEAYFEYVPNQLGSWSVKVSWA